MPKVVVILHGMWIKVEPEEEHVGWEETQGEDENED